MKKTDWIKLGLICNILMFVLLSHVVFGLDAPVNPYSKDVYVTYIAWGLAGVCLICKAASGCFGILFEDRE